MDNMATHDGEAHDRLRKLVSKAFTPRRVADTRPLIEEITADLLDRLAAVPLGEPVDLRSRFSYPLPARVICDLLGVPVEVRADALRGGEVNISTSLTPEEAAANVEQWHVARAVRGRTHRTNTGERRSSWIIRSWPRAW